MIDPKNKLIIVEGLTGLGKSTMAHLIARQLQYNGFNARWIHEGEDPHPVSIDVEPDITTFMDNSLKIWGSFVSQIQASDQVTVIEASYFNNLIESLFAHCLHKQEIIDFGLKLQQVIEPVKPALIYLTHGNIPTALEKNFRNRGVGFKDFVIRYVSSTPIAEVQHWKDYAGVVMFWQEFAAITDALFQQYRIDKLMLDVSGGNWESYNHQAVEFLSLSWVPDPLISQAEAEKFVGVYRIRDGGRDHTIQYENGTLVTDIFMNVKTKLIPKNVSSFLVEKWHFELLFDQAASGDMTSFTIAGRDIDYLKAVGTVAEKVKS
jgi:hypothetical protein